MSDQSQSRPSSEAKSSTTAVAKSSTVEGTSATGQRPAVSDGRTLRQIWRPYDGNGDPDVGIFEATRNKLEGHPTWKLYCGNLPASVNGEFREPPSHVYLDDRACYHIFHFAGFTGAERGRKWRHDFDNKGNVKPNRKARGRPAIYNREVCEIQTGPNKVVRFSGAMDRKDVELIMQELDAQARNEELLVPPPEPKNGKRKGGALVAKENKRPASAKFLNGVDTAPTRPSFMGPEDLTIITDGAPRLPLKDQTFAVIATNNVSELRATVISLQDRARITSDAVLDLQKKNEHLEQALKAQRVLSQRTHNDLVATRAANAELIASFNKTKPELNTQLAAEQGAIAAQYWASTYRSMAIQLWIKQQNTDDVLAKSAAAAEAIHGLTRTLRGMEGALEPVRREQGKVEEGWEDTKGTMKAMLGPEEWDTFEEGLKRFQKEQR